MLTPMVSLIMQAIIGLGNPGPPFRHTRHNVGFFIIDALKAHLRLPPLVHHKKFASAITKNQEYLLAKPQTFMNQSGKAVAHILAFYKIKPQNLWVIHDDIDIALGRYKIQKNRGAAGHKGILSIIAALKTRDFHRIRIGIKPPGEKKVPTETFVLQKFTPREAATVQELTAKILEHCWPR